MKKKKLYALSTTTMFLGEPSTTLHRGLTLTELKKLLSKKVTLWVRQGVAFHITEDWTDR